MVLLLAAVHFHLRAAHRVRDRRIEINLLGTGSSTQN